MRLLSNLHVKGKPAVLPDRAIRRQSHYFIYRPRTFGNWDTGWTNERSWFIFRQQQEISFFFKTARPGLKSTQPHVQWVLRILTLGAKERGCKADHSRHLLSRSRMSGALTLLSLTLA